MKISKKVSASLVAGSLVLASLVATQVFGVVSTAQAAGERSAINAPTNDCGLVGNSAVTYSYMTYLRDDSNAGNTEKSADYIKNSAFIEPVADSSLPSNQRKWKATFNAGPLSVTSDRHQDDYTSNPWFSVYVSKGWKFVEDSLQIGSTHVAANGTTTMETVDTSKISLKNREIYPDVFHNFSDGEALREWFVVGEKTDDDKGNYLYPSGTVHVSPLSYDVHSLLAGKYGPDSATAPSLMRKLDYPKREDGSATGDYFINNSRSAFLFSYYTKSHLRDRKITVFFKTEVDSKTTSPDGYHFVGANYKSYDNGHRHVRSVAAVTPPTNCLQSTPIRVNVKEKIADTAASSGAKIPAHNIELSTIERFGRDVPVTLAVNTRNAPLEQNYTYYSTGAAYDRDVMQMRVKGIGSNASSNFSWFDWTGATYKGRYGGMEYKITHSIDLQRDTDRTPVSNWLVEWYPIPDQPLPPEFDLAKVTKLFVQQGPSKTEYNQGDKLDVSDVMVTLEDSTYAHKQILRSEFDSYGIGINPAGGSVLNTAGDNVPVKFYLKNKTNIYDTVYVNVKAKPVVETKPVVESLSASPNQPEAGQSVTLTGLVKKDGAPLANQKLWVNAGGRLYAAVTDSKGNLIDNATKKPIVFAAGAPKTEMVIRVFDNDRQTGSPLKELKLTPKVSPFNPANSKIQVLEPSGSNLIAADTIESGTPIRVKVVFNDNQNNIYADGPAYMKINVPGLTDPVTLVKQMDGTYVVLVKPVKATTATSSTPAEKADNLIKVEATAGEFAKIKPAVLNIVAGKPAAELDSSVKDSGATPSALVLEPKDVEVNKTPVKGTVTLKDKYGNPVPGAKPVIAVNGVNNPAIKVSEKSGEPGVYEFTYTPTTDGKQTLSVKENDKAAPVASADLTVNPKKGKTSAPQELKLRNQKGSWTLSGKAAPNATIKVKLGDQEIATGTATDGTFSLPLNQAPVEGNKLFSVTALESGKEESEIAKVEADLVAPAKANITPAPYAGDSTLSVVLPSDKDIVKAKLTLPGETTPIELTKANGSWTANPAEKITKVEEKPLGTLVVTPKTPLGSGDLKVTLEDETGNASPEAVASVVARGQTPAPTNLEVYKSPDGIWHVKGLATPSAVIKVKVASNPEIMGYAGGRSGAFDIEIADQLNDKDEVKVTATKAPSTESPEAKAVVDAKAPAKPVITPGLSGDTTLGVTLPEDDDLARIEISLPGEDKPVVVTKQENGSWVDEQGKVVPVSADGKLQITIPALKPGKVEASVVDKAGNKSESGEGDIDERTMAPTKVSAVEKDGILHVIGKTEPGADVNVKIPGVEQPFTTKADPNTGAFHLKLPADVKVPEGAQLEVTATKDGKAESAKTTVAVTGTKKDPNTTPETQPDVPKPQPSQPVDKTCKLPEFKDTASSPFYRHIRWMQCEGITKGWPDGTYHPSEGISRIAMAAFLYRMAGSPAVQLPAQSPLHDMKPGDDFYKEFVWCYQNGITTGYKDGTFRPNDFIARDAMAAFLHRYDNIYHVVKQVEASAPKFIDVTSDNHLAKDIDWLRRAGITTGYADGTYRPYDPISREAMAAFIYRMVNGKN